MPKCGAMSSDLMNRKKKTHVFLGATVPVLEPHVFHVGVFGEEGCLNQKKNGDARRS